MLLDLLAWKATPEMVFVSFGQPCPTRPPEAFDASELWRVVLLDTVAARRAGASRDETEMLTALQGNWTRRMQHAYLEERCTALGPQRGRELLGKMLVTKAIEPAEETAMLYGVCRRTRTSFPPDAVSLALDRAYRAGSRASFEAVLDFRPYSVPDQVDADERRAILQAAALGSYRGIRRLVTSQEAARVISDQFLCIHGSGTVASATVGVRPTPLMMACRRIGVDPDLTALDSLTFLLAMGAEADGQDEQGATPLLYVTGFGGKQIDPLSTEAVVVPAIKALVRHGADVNKGLTHSVALTDAEQGYTPGTWAPGTTPLMVATAMCVAGRGEAWEQILASLVSLGANPDLQNRDGLSAKRLAAGNDTLLAILGTH
jgi:ankyrin repeat protein